jgi:hypothetical protein
MNEMPASDLRQLATTLVTECWPDKFQTGGRNGWWQGVAKRAVRYGDVPASQERELWTLLVSNYQMRRLRLED